MTTTNTPAATATTASLTDTKYRKHFSTHAVEYTDVDGSIIYKSEGKFNNATFMTDPAQANEFNVNKTIDECIEKGFMTNEDMAKVWMGDKSIKTKINFDAIDFEANPHLKEKLDVSSPRFRKIVEMMKGRIKHISRNKVTPVKIPTAQAVRGTLANPSRVDIDGTNNGRLLRALYADNPSELERRLEVIKSRSSLKRVVIQPLHAASRMQELGFDPLKALIDRYYEMQLMLDTMRTYRKRSLIAEANLFSTLQKTATDLAAYGYLTQAQVKAWEEKNKGGPDDNDTGINIFISNEDGVHIATATNGATLATPTANGATLGANTPVDTSVTVVPANGATLAPATIDENTPAAATAPAWTEITGVSDSTNANTNALGSNSEDDIGDDNFVDTGEEFMVNTTATFVPSPDVHESLRGIEYSARRDCELGLMQISDDDGIIIPVTDSMSTTQHTTVAVMSKLVNETNANLTRKDDDEALTAE